MSESKSQPTANASPTLPMITTIVSVVALIVLLAFTAKMEEYELLGFLVPYEAYISAGLVVLLGHMAVQSGTKWAFAIAQRRISTDVARTLRIITRLVGYGLIFSFLVSVLTDNAAAALTMGSFMGLVAGFATQAVMGNTVAGIFMVLARPIGIGDSVAIGSNSGTVADITLMHIILETDDRRILIPSSNVVSSVLVKHKPSE